MVQASTDCRLTSFCPSFIRFSKPDLILDLKFRNLASFAYSYFAFSSFASRLFCHASSIFFFCSNASLRFCSTVIPFGSKYSRRDLMSTSYRSK